MLVPALLLLASLQSPEQLPFRARCDTSTERLADLVHHAEILRDDPVWSAHRKQWGWTGHERITPVSDPRVCQQAAAALVRDGRKGAATIVTVVQVGKNYVAEPGDESDLWIVLDKRCRIQARVTIPS
jgi:hypothetical protein